MTTVFFLKQEETRTSNGPIPHPLRFIAMVFIAIGAVIDPNRENFSCRDLGGAGEGNQVRNRIHFHWIMFPNLSSCLQNESPPHTITADNRSKISQINSFHRSKLSKNSPIMCKICRYGNADKNVGKQVNTFWISPNWQSISVGPKISKSSQIVPQICRHGNHDNKKNKKTKKKNLLN